MRKQYEQSLKGVERNSRTAVEFTSKLKTFKVFLEEHRNQKNQFTFIKMIRKK